MRKMKDKKLLKWVVENLNNLTVFQCAGDWYAEIAEDIAVSPTESKTKLGAIKKLYKIMTEDN
jgi:hypothetical protein